MIPEWDDIKPAKVKRVVFCSGKVYWELLEKRRELELEDVAIVRIEQLYPFHAEMARDMIAGYPKDAHFCWVQEEPRNMGPYLYMADTLREQLELDDLEYIGRDTSASTATGSKKKDRSQQEAIVTAAVAPKPEADTKSQGMSDGKRALAAG